MSGSESQREIPLASLCSSSRELYEEWDLSPPTISPRSELYWLEPIGIGTPYVESLSSYFRRLADAHCVSIAHLFEEKVAPLMGRQYLIQGTSTKWSSFLGTNYRYVTINGIGSMASDWIRCLEELTLRTGLRDHTMNVWSNVVSSRELFHDKPRWCSSCFNAWQKEGQEIREPLLWTLRPVQICDLHQRRLSFLCPHCNRVPQPLCVSPNLGYCSHCGDWLGELVQANEELEEIELNWQNWVTQSLRQMLIAAPTVSDMPLRSKITTSITQLIDELCCGNNTAFAQQIGRTKTTVWGWMNLEHRIRIADLLAACYWAQLAPVDLLLSDLRSGVRRTAPFNHVRPSPPPELGKPIRVVRCLDKDEIKAQLESLLRSGNVPASLREVAALVNIDRVHLSRLFPELCKLLVAECKKARADKKINRDSERYSNIQAAIAEAGERQLNVSRRVIASILRRHGKPIDEELISTALRDIRLLRLRPLDPKTDAIPPTYLAAFVPSAMNPNRGM